MSGHFVMGASVCLDEYNLYNFTIEYIFSTRPPLNHIQSSSNPCLLDLVYKGKTIKPCASVEYHWS